MNERVTVERGDAVDQEWDDIPRIQPGNARTANYHMARCTGFLIKGLLNPFLGAALLRKTASESLKGWQEGWKNHKDECEHLKMQALQKKATKAAQKERMKAAVRGAYGPTEPAAV